MIKYLQNTKVIIVEESHTFPSSQSSLEQASFANIPSGCQNVNWPVLLRSARGAAGMTWDAASLAPQYNVFVCRLQGAIAHRGGSPWVRSPIPDSNFSLQQACHKFVMTRVQVCHKFVITRVQVCHKFVMTRVQACSKLTKAPKSP
ncbi:hypothetical protein AVEN_246623-1 [Araneus ventricosus]|uniref:Uncharacterized protein n=1 Tax=Araneus ventricosus TaxID=182803 RepID=A0A4Y2UE33_ARAVE|nr:hypothetical protein AVEN_246623-1 [Araneus ventricosus]